MKRFGLYLVRIVRDLVMRIVLCVLLIFSFVGFIVVMLISGPKKLGMLYMIHGARLCGLKKEFDDFLKMLTYVKNESEDN